MKHLLNLRSAFVATVDALKRPEVETRPVEAYDEQTLIFSEQNPNSCTLENLRRNSQITIIAWSGAAFPYGRNRAYKFTGNPEIHEADRIFQEYTKTLEEQPSCVITLQINQIHLHKPGWGWVQQAS